MTRFQLFDALDLSILFNLWQSPKMRCCIFCVNVGGGRYFCINAGKSILSRSWKNFSRSGCGCADRSRLGFPWIAVFRSTSSVNIFDLHWSKKAFPFLEFNRINEVPWSSSRSGRVFPIPQKSPKVISPCRGIPMEGHAWQEGRR